MKEIELAKIIKKSKVLDKNQLLKRQSESPFSQIIQKISSDSGIKSNYSLLKYAYTTDATQYNNREDITNISEIELKLKKKTGAVKSNSKLKQNSKKEKTSNKTKISKKPVQENSAQQIDKKKKKKTLTIKNPSLKAPKIVAKNPKDSDSKKKKSKKVIKPIIEQFKPRNKETKKREEKIIIVPPKLTVDKKSKAKKTNIKKSDKRKDSTNFTDWLNNFNKVQKKKEKKKDKKPNQKSKKSDKVGTKSELKEKISSSIKKKDEIATETLAQLYAEQGYRKKAILMYQKLIEKNPDKIKFYNQIISKLKK